MILLVGTEEDRMLVYFAKFLAKINKKFLFFNQKYILLGNDILNSGLRIKGEKYSYRDFSGVLNRCTFPDPDELSKVSPRYKTAISCLFNILSYRFQNVLNPAYLGISNDSKMFQLSLLKLNIIKKVDYLILAKTDVKQAISTRLGNETIVKSLSSIRSEVVQYEGNEEKYFLKKSDEPVLFQKLIQGDNIRVHVIVDQCFAVIITSSAVDYRYGETAPKFEKYKLPKSISEECIDISKQMQLKFCGIDLIKKGNEYYILEVNPAPGWTYFEEPTGASDMSSKLAKELACE